MTTAKVIYNPFAPGFRENPYPQYAALRAAGPLHYPSLGIWFISSYRDVRTLLRSPKVSVNTGIATAATSGTERRQFEGVPVIGKDSMLNVDPPTHTRLRRLVSKAFTPRMLAKMHGGIIDRVDQVLDRADREGGLDLIADLAFPLPFGVIGELLGMPPTDAATLRELSGRMVQAVDPIPGPAKFQMIVKAAFELEALIKDAIAWKRQRASDDLLSALMNVEDEGEVLSEAELVSQVGLLYIAGHETTVNLIGNGTLALLRDAHQLALLRDRADLDLNAVEELLRFDPPVQMTRRVTTDEIQLGDLTLPGGSYVILGIAAANRDEEKWGPTADQIDFFREDVRDHLSFGSGHHQCLGMHLGKLEGQMAIGRLIRRFPHIEMSGEPTYSKRINLRGLQSLPLSVR